MEEDNYRNSYNNFVPVRCIFERSLLARHCMCSKAQQLNLAEREAIKCRGNEYQENCEKIYEHLLKNCQFVFHRTNPDEPLPFAKQIKLQSGSLHVLNQILYHSENSGVNDVYQLLQDVLTKWSSFENIPIQELLKGVASFKVRNKKGKN